MRVWIGLPLALILCGAAVAQSTGTLVPGRDSAGYVMSEGALRTRDTPPPNIEKAPSDKQIVIARRFADCMVRKNPSLTATVLKSENLTSPAERSRLSMVMSVCLGGAADSGNWNARFGGGTFRALIADAYLRKAGVPDLPITAYASVSEGSDLYYSDPGQKVVARTADCLVAREPQAVARLLRLEPDSASEGATFAALSPAIGPCLEKDVKLGATRNSLRLALALAVYRRTQMQKLAGTH